MRVENFKLKGERRFAFTIIEVMLAVGIFSFVLVAIYASWSAIMRGTRIGLTAAAEVQRTRVAIRSLEEALAGAVMYSDNPLYYGFFADTQGQFAYLSFVTRLPESFPGSGMFPGKPLRRVTFRVDEKRNLLLSQSELLDLSETPYTITLAPNTAVFTMDFFNPRVNEWLADWMATNALPSLVRVAIDFGETKKGTVTVRSIPLTAFAISRIGAVAGGGPPRGGRMGGGGLGEAYNGPRWNGPPGLPGNFGQNFGPGMGMGGSGRPPNTAQYP